MLKIKYYIYFLLIIFSSTTSAIEWDLDGALRAANDGGVNLQDEYKNTVQTLSKAQLNEINDARNKISRAAGIYPKVIIDSNNDINAYATWHSGQPIIGITLGLIRATQNDIDALAAVIGHEHAHLTLKHQTSQATQNLIVDVLGALALAAIDASWGGAAYNPYRGFHQVGLEVGKTLSKTSFSRSDEYEADEQGIRYAISAGYSPDGAIRFHRMLDKSSHFFSTHPSSEDRIEKIVASLSNETQSQRIAKNNSYGFSETNIVTNKTYKSNNEPIIQTEYTNDAHQACIDKGYEEGSSQHFACIFKFKKIKSQLEKVKSQANTHYEDDFNSNLPIKGQIGLVLVKKPEKNLIIFSPSISQKIPNGAAITVKNNSNFSNGTIISEYEGFYAAKIDSINNIDKGSRVVIQE